MRPPLVDEDRHVICQAVFSKVSKDQNGKPTTVTSSCTKRSQCEKSEENKKAKALWALKEAKDKGMDFLRSGQGAEGPNKIPSKIGSFGESDGCCGRGYF